MGLVVQRCDGGSSDSVSMAGKVADDLLPHAMWFNFVRIRREAGDDYGAARMRKVRLGKGVA